MPSRHSLVLIPAAALAAAAGLASCGGDDPIFPEDFATSYVAVSDCVNSIDHDFRHVRIWVNPEAEADYCAGNEPLAVGTTIVKEEFDDDACTELVAYAAMKKEAPGFNPAADDWNWQRLDERMRGTSTGAIEVCMDCHRTFDATACPSRDYTCLVLASRCP